MAWLLIGVASLLALLVLGRLLAGVDAATMARALRWVGITLAVVLAAASGASTPGALKREACRCSPGCSAAWRCSCGGRAT